MKKLFVFLVAIFLATSVYALTETADNGPQNITSCYITGTAALTSGSVVVLQTSSPTYPGKEVTGSVTTGQGIYGVVVDTTNYTATEMKTGHWVRVQTYGYVPNIKAGFGTVVASKDVTAGQGLYCSDTAFIAEPTSSAQITGNVVALESYAGTGTNTDPSVVEGFIALGGL